GRRGPRPQGHKVRGRQTARTRWPRACWSRHAHGVLRPEHV
ncbi:MAG: hypothetical protein AVDCRST_MAG55-2738, partial [uncultured Rubrobacteraceae bacterium]